MSLHSVLKVLILLGISCSSLQGVSAHPLTRTGEIVNPHGSAQIQVLTHPQAPIQILIADKTTAKDDSETAKSFSGNASWYGMPFHGRKTASGEIFDMNKLTAAHKTLPMPTKVMVENPKNGQSCVIRVIDRGPYARGRVLDLSREAAKRIGIFPGVGYVEATVLPSTSVTKDKK